MLRRAIVMTGILFLFIPGLFAQEFKFEFTPFIGYTFSEGVDVDPQDTVVGRVTAITPKSAISYGFIVDVLPTENWAIGFLYDTQRSTLEATLQGEGKRDFTDMAVNNYHAIFTYNFNDEDEALRPFFFGGLGATQYSPDDIEGNSVESNTRFSSTWGGGVKVFASDHIGFKLMGRWTPTYIKTDANGIWCSPYWGGSCWIVGNPDYSNQFELSAGLTLRF